MSQLYTKQAGANNGVFRKFMGDTVRGSISISIKVEQN